MNKARCFGRYKYRKRCRNCKVLNICVYGTMYNILMNQSKWDRFVNKINKWRV